MKVTVTIAGTQIGLTRISMGEVAVAADMADIRSELVLMKEFVDCVYCSTLKI